MFRYVPWDARHIFGGLREYIQICWSRSHSLARALSMRLEPILTVCSVCFRLIAALILSYSTLFTGGGWSSGPETIAHSMGMILLLLSVSVPPITGNFIILCVVDGTAFIFRNPGLPMIPLYGDVDLTTMNSIPNFHQS
ncbi:hypothetical protein Tco_0301454 [Tanacetum coccineum]